MGNTIWIMLWLAVMLIALVKIGYHDKIFKKIQFEDRMDFRLDKPLPTKKYRKLFKEKFSPYLIEMTNDMNVKIFDDFERFYSNIDMLGYKQPYLFHIVFVDKITGYRHDENQGTYNVFIKNDNIPFITKDKEIAELIKKILYSDATKNNEFAIEGAIVLNKHTYFLKNLTSISSYKNVLRGRVYSDLVFKFGMTRVVVRFNSFKESYDFLFNSDKSDIRLIEKISNAGLINYSRRQEE